MAKISFSLEELLTILVANELVPDRIQQPRGKGETIEFVVKTGIVILPAVPVSLTYAGYEDNNITFEISVAGGRFGEMIGGYTRQFESKMPPGVRLDFPHIHVDANKLLEARNIRGVAVEGISVSGDEFTIVASSK